MPFLALDHPKDRQNGVENIYVRFLDFGVLWP